ncbi:uncharacterized protein VTP21DRAFT_9712 [Calcarisporiella thermophila]|uniref:uncharacterized protein n=1 Tax=Calcarisporiella thermophila TaxID=911321 RepID=UPI003743078C
MAMGQLDTEHLSSPTAAHAGGGNSSSDKQIIGDVDMQTAMRHPAIGWTWHFSSLVTDRVLEGLGLLEAITNEKIDCRSSIVRPQHSTPGVVCPWVACPDRRLTPAALHQNGIQLGVFRMLGLSSLAQSSSTSEIRTVFKILMLLVSGEISSETLQGYTRADRAFGPAGSQIRD